MFAEQLKGREDTEKDSGDKETNKGTYVPMDGQKERHDKMKKGRLKGYVMERRRGYVTAAGLCVNVVSTL